MYSTAHLVNLLISFYLWKVSSEDLHKTSTLIWGSSLVNFVLQLMFQEQDIKMLISYSAYLVTSIFLFQFSIKTLGIQHKNKKPVTASLIFIILSYIGLFSGLSYQLSSAICSFGISIPMFYASYLIFREKTNVYRTTKMLGVILIINSLHFLIYPNLIFIDSGVMFGFPVALLILFMFSMFFPAHIIEKTNSNYTQKLQNEVVNKTKEISLISEENRNLLTIVCHDLSNPLTILKFHADKLSGLQALQGDTNIDFACNQSIAKIQSSVKSVISILNKVKELQIVKSGKSSVHLENINLHNCLLEAISLYSTFLAEKKISVKIEGHETINPQICGDQVLIVHQVLGNLLSNAIKFSEKNGQILFQFYAKDNRIGLKIKDSGIGIPDEIVKNLFSYSTNKSRRGTDNEGGTGFGMPLVKTCVDLMSGTISVQSNEIKKTEDTEHGSTFTLEFKKVS
jgi:signal transduction histidine kinase